MLTSSVNIHFKVVSTRKQNALENVQTETLARDATGSGGWQLPYPDPPPSPVPPLCKMREKNTQDSAAPRQPWNEVTYNFFQRINTQDKPINLMARGKCWRHTAVQATVTFHPFVITIRDWHCLWC